MTDETQTPSTAPTAQSAGGEAPTLPAQLDAAEVRRRISPRSAREALERALAAGFDPAADPARVPVAAGEGQLLLMPSTIGDVTGVKIASVSPGNPERGLPRIQALYLLMDSATLTPIAILDGAELTAVRTPAVTAVAADHLAAPDASRAVIIGSGPQAQAHAHAMAEIRELDDIVLVGRSRERLQAAVDRLVRGGLPARAAAEDETREAIRGAQIIVCATTAATPVLEDADIAPGAFVAAIGSHEPDKRELPAALLQRSLVVVEDSATALREAGDVIIAIEEGALGEDALVSLADVVAGRTARPADAPVVFKGTGMGWEDLAVAATALDEPRA